MMKPKYTEKKKIDSWLCCWCGANNNDTQMMDIEMQDTKECEACGGKNILHASVEYMTHPTNEDGKEVGNNDGM